MLTSSALKSLVYSCLTAPQQEAAIGRFSDPPILTDDEVAASSRYFDDAFNSTIAKFTLASAHAILYVRGDAFHILSSPRMALHDSGLEIFIGHDGNHLFHPTPISILVKDATSHVLALLNISDDPTDPSALHALGAQHYITETLTDTEANEDGELVHNVTFPFPVDLTGVLPNRDQYKLAALPTAIPLPSGHSLESVSLTDEPSLTTFLEQLQDVSQKHAEWAAAIILSTQLYDGRSIHLHEPTVPRAFLEGLTVDEFKDDIFVIASPVTASSLEGRNLLQRTTAVRNTNIDRWFEANPDIYGQHARRYAIGANPNSAPSPNAIASPIVYESLKDRSAKHNIARARTITQLLLAREGTNANGDKIIIPGTVSSTFEDAVNDTAPRALRYLTEQVVSIAQEKNGSMDMADRLMTNFPLVVLTPSFVATALNGYWSVLPLAQETATVGNNLSFFSFAPVPMNTAEHKRQLDESTTVLNEDLVGVSTNQRTKATLQLYSGGLFRTHHDLLQGIANSTVILKVLDAPDQEPAIFTTALRQLFQCLSDATVSRWATTFARRPEGRHLPYALALEINNNIFVQLTKFATNSKWTKAVLEGTEIPATALTDFRSMFDITVNNWRKVASTDSLSHYSSPPSTYINPEVAKEAAKKAAKTSDTSSPSSKPTGRTGNTPHQQSTPSRPAARDPTFGMIIAPDNIRHGPQLPSGKRLCLHFAVQGKACTNGYNCTNAHVTLNRASIPDLKAIERWVTDTTQVKWAVGRPKRLGEASSARTPESPQASPTPAQVSPPAATNGNQG